MGTKHPGHLSPGHAQSRAVPSTLPCAVPWGTVLTDSCLRLCPTAGHVQTPGQTPNAERDTILIVEASHRAK